MSGTKDMTMRERLIQLGVLLPAQRLPEPGGEDRSPRPLPPRDGVQLSGKLQHLRDEERW